MTIDEARSTLNRAKEGGDVTEHAIHEALTTLGDLAPEPQSKPEFPDLAGLWFQTASVTPNDVWLGHIPTQDAVSRAAMALPRVFVRGRRATTTGGVI